MVTPNDKLRRLIDRAKTLRGTVDGWPTLIEEIEAMASEAASPVTDAEVEAAIESVRVAAHRYGVDAWAPTLIDESQALKSQEDKAVCDLRALIARRVQQAGAAAEELARAADAYVSLPAEHFQIRGTLFRDLCTALAAFRAAQGGAS